MAKRKLGPLDIEITHREGAQIYDPNSLTFAIFDSANKTLELEPTSLKSVISKEPALIYRTDEVEIPLTAPEISRLTLRSLTPNEFQTLEQAYGTFFEIHEDFYDMSTGEALQPS